MLSYLATILFIILLVISAFLFLHYLHVHNYVAPIDQVKSLLTSRICSLIKTCRSSSCVVSIARELKIEGYCRGQVVSVYCEYTAHGQCIFIISLTCDRVKRLINITCSGVLG